MSRAGFTLIAIALMTLRGGLARADSPPNEASAQALFEQGRDDMRRGAYADACPKFAESERMDPSNGTLLNLVLCEEKLGKVASAWSHAQELVGRLSQADPRKAIAERRSRALSKRLPKLTVRLEPNAGNDCKILLDGAELAASRLDMPLPIDPGLHRIVVKAPERADRTSELSIEEGQAYEFSVEPGARLAETVSGPPVPAPTSVSSAPTPPHRNAGQPTQGLDRRSAANGVGRTEAPPRWLGWAAGGIGVAALAVSAVLGAMVLDRKAAVEATCPEKKCRDSSGMEAAEEGRLLETGAIAALAVAATGVGVGIFILTRSEPGVTPGSKGAFLKAGASAFVVYTAPF
jgi:hypothetical protein